MRIGIRRTSVLFALAAAGWLLRAAVPGNLADLRAAFQRPPDEARIMMRWWWFGPAVVQPELAREMRLMKEGGIGGFEVQPVYPLEVNGNFPYLSPEFLDDLKFTAGEARQLGLRFDLTLGSGWPFGGPHIPITEAAARLRMDRVPVPANASSVPLPQIGEGEKFLGAFLARGDRRQFAAEGIQRINPSGGTVTVPSQPGEGRVVLFFIESRTKQTVKRPSMGAEGWVLNHYDRKAIDTHLNAVGEKLLGALGKDLPYAIFSDSLEVYNSDWTPGLLEEFRKRRGYDLMQYLPALAGDMGDKTAAIRHDWGKTLTDLCEEQYLKPLTEWAHRHGTKFRSQTYGIPPVTLSSQALVDLPEGEGTEWRHFSSTRWATSASHLYGRPVTSSETWTWLHSPVFRATPLDMKAEADLHFLQGINQLIGHGWPYSPPEAGEPGWRFYAAAVFNQHNPWWIAMPDVSRYFQRVSHLLRQGEPANDVAVYLPTADAYARFTLGRDSVNQAMDGLIGPNVIPQILDAGYNFDFIDDGAIAKLGVPHKILVLPNVERMPLATLQKITEYARKGGTVIATRRTPSLAPGLMEAEHDTPRIRELAKGLKLVSGESKLGEALHAALPADVAASPEVGFVHRKLPFAEIYFLANTSNHSVKAPVKFRSSGNAMRWNPVTGEESALADLDLAPYESTVVVISKGAAPAKRPAAPARELDITSEWKLTIAGQAVQSWPPNFSGVGTYEKVVTVPADLAGPRVFLNFGEGTAIPSARRVNGMRALFDGPVRDAAVVHVNGKRAGSVWCAPYEVNVGGLLKAGENTLRIEVGNSALNALASRPLPDYKALTAKFGERFQAQDMGAVAPQPSGLLSGIKLMVK